MWSGCIGVLKNGTQAIGQSRGGRYTVIHLIVMKEITSVVFHLSLGLSADDSEIRKLAVRQT